MNAAFTGEIPHIGPSGADASAFDAVLTATRNEPPGEPDLEGLARRVLRSALEQLRVRQARQAAASPSWPRELSGESAPSPAA